MKNISGIIVKIIPSIMIIIPLIIVMTLILSGCSQNTALTNYRTGTDGLSIDFLSSNTKSVYEGDEFGLEIRVTNKGSADVLESNPGILKITYDNYRVTAIRDTAEKSQDNIVLKGKSQYYPVGDEFPVGFYFNASRLTHLREGATTSINFNLCYPYSTELTTMTCIDTKTANNDQTTSACTSETYDGSSGQGGPIVITKIEPETLLQQNYIRPQFKIYIENKGTGYVTKSTSCTAADFNNADSSSRVNIKAWLSGVQLECGPDNSGVVRLTDSESFITCYLPNNNGYNRTQRNYITSLTINVSYTYILIAKQDIEIKRNDNLEPVDTSSKCNDYQIEYNGKCLDKCDYCSGNQGDSRCGTTTMPDSFSFNENFSCSCSQQQCVDKQDNGNCVHESGFCAGNLYCCTNNKCDQWQIEYNGECIDKCAYCADKTHATDTSVCGSLDFTGFECRSMTLDQCKSASKDGNCRQGYCGGVNKDTMYCANDAAATTPATPVTGNIVLNNNNNNNEKSAENSYATDKSNTAEITQTNLCDYCAKEDSNNHDDPECTFVNGAVVGKITNKFQCACSIDDGKKLSSYDFVPDRSLCDPEYGLESDTESEGAYCCRDAAKN